MNKTLISGHKYVPFTFHIDTQSSLIPISAGVTIGAVAMLAIVVISVIIFQRYECVVLYIHDTMYGLKGVSMNYVN